MGRSSDGTKMSKERVEAYLRHIDMYGIDEVEETAQIDKNLTDEEKAAIVAYLKTKVPSTKRSRKRNQK